jgi:tetratricopeptide (TPR) repeat protein
MPHDVFFSYRTREADLAAPLLAALEAQGLTVWRDKARLDAGDAISQPVRDALAASRTLIAFYSAAYNDSPICQWELATAWSAARAAGPPTDRVLLALPPGVNSPQHVHLVASGAVGDHRSEFDALGFRCPTEDAPAEVWTDLARAIAARVRAVDARTFGALADLTRPTFPLHKPDRSNRFVGRLPDLWRLDGLLHAGRNVIVSGHADSVAQVVGMGGVGKTLFATEYVSHFAPAWPGGVIWIRDPSRDPDDVLYELAPRLNHALAALDRDGRVAAARHHLENKRYLWVLDNVAADLTDLGQRCAPTASGATLITTRSTNFDSLGATYNLDVLLPADALALLTKDRPASDADRPDAIALCQAVGHHPLAVDVLRGLVAQQSGPNPFAAWRLRLADSTRDALANDILADTRLPNTYPKNVAPVLQSSLADLSPAGWDILRAASQLAELPIPIDLLDAMLALVNDAPADDDLRDRRAAGVNAAIARSLARRDGDDVVVHTLVSRVVRTVDAQPERAAKLREVVPGALLGLLQEVKDIRTHPRLASVVEHARDETAGELDVSRARLAVTLATYDRTRGDSRSSRALAERALAVLIPVLGDEHPDTLRALQNLAGTLYTQGDLAQARAVDERTLDAQTRLLGPEHPDTLNTLQNLAGTLYAQGDLSGARSNFERALEVMSRRLGPEHPHTLTTLQNLAGTLNAQGDLAAARATYERALEAQARLLGPEHVDTLTTLQNLAGTLLAQGDLTAARATFERALEARTRLLGSEHPDTLTTLQNLAVTLNAQGDLTAARVSYERALDAMTRLLGPEHPKTLNTLQNLAGILFAQGYLDAARALLERVFEARTRLLGPEHPDTLNTLQNLAGTLNGQGDFTAARAAFEQALDARTRLLGPEHPDTLITLQNLAGTLYARGDLTAARAAFEQAFEAMTRRLGPEHPDTLNTLQNLAVTLKAQGHLTAARAPYERVLEAQSRTLGPNHPDARTTRFNLLLNLLNLGEVEAARPHITALSVLETLPDAALSATDRHIRAKLPTLRQRLR